jgi:tRNA(His) 5'-end guanylyltransferase
MPKLCPEKRKPADTATFVMPYSGRVLKLCSVLAGSASAAFAAALMGGTEPRPDLLRLMPAFDCRVWQVPTPAQALQGLHVRQVYVLKNARMMYAQHHLSHRALQGVSSKAAAQLVVAKLGPDHAFEAKVPEAVRVGTYGLWVPTVVEGRDAPLVRNKLHLVVHFGTLSAAAAVE